MLKIGEFSKLSRISIRMLRHYDEAGILKPQSVDSVTGYRFMGNSSCCTPVKSKLCVRWGLVSMPLVRF